jgi:hypothetical protein
VESNENDYPYAGNPVEHPGNHRGSTLVFEALEEADISAEAHRILLVESRIE